MSKVLIFTDLHITKDSLPECREVLSEIIQQAVANDVEFIVNLGDTFDSVRPGNECLDMFASFLHKCPKHSVHIVAKSHESIEENNSILNHFGILIDTADFYPGSYEIFDSLYGHFMLKESQYAFVEKRSVEEFKKYRRVFLGHQHSFQMYSNVVHPGSCRYITFPEHKDTKYFILYDLDTDEVTKVPIKSCIPMQVIKVTDTDTPQCILGLPNKLKLKLLFDNDVTFRNHINYFSQYKERFTLFKHQLLKLAPVINEKTEESKGFINAYIDWVMQNVEDVEVKNILLEEASNEDN